jgi:hypothetical protein
MHGQPPPPEHIRTLRALLAIAKDNRELEDAVVTFALALHRHAYETGRELGYAEGLRQGRTRGRRRAKGLDEIAKPNGRPRSVDRILKEAGLSWQDFREK